MHIITSPLDKGVGRRASAELLNLPSTFTPTGTVETARDAHTATATLRGNMKVLVVGGVDLQNLRSLLQRMR
jgi:hypothetical protein